MENKLVCFRESIKKNNGKYKFRMFTSMLVNSLISLRELPSRYKRRCGSGGCLFGEYLKITGQPMSVLFQD